MPSSPSYKRNTYAANRKLNIPELITLATDKTEPLGICVHLAFLYFICDIRVCTADTFFMDEPYTLEGHWTHGIRWVHKFHFDPQG